MKGVLPLTAVLLTVGAQPAAAAFPGTNGLIAMERQGPNGVAIATVNADGTGNRDGVIAEGPQNRDPSWSPDGRHLAFTSTRDGNEEIYVYDTDNGAQNRVTFDAARDHDPAWSPDGTRLAFASTRTGNSEIFVVPASGGFPTRLTFNPADDRQPAWSSTGTIAFASSRTNDFDLYAMAEDGSALRQLTQDPGLELDPSWSPAGARLAYSHSDLGASYDIFVTDAGVTNARPLVATAVNEHFPVWSPDGTRVAFVRETGPTVAVVGVDDPAGTYAQVAQGTEPNWAPLPTPVAGPDAGQTITLAPVGNVVLVAPATTQRPSTVPVLQAQLRGPSEVPVGTTVNATAGTLAIEAITTTPDGPGTIGHADVSGGVFTIDQVGTGEPTLRMQPGIRRCQPPRRGVAARVPPEARMRVRSRGRFRTVGGYGRGAARGTEWAMRERCDGTVFQVFEGVVSVHDYGRKRTFEVPAGQCYLAAARGRPAPPAPTPTCPPVGKRAR